MPFADLSTGLPDAHAEEEWTLLIKGAAGLLLIADARLFGLVRGGPSIDRHRCEEVLAHAATLGFAVDDLDAAGAAVEFMAGWNGQETDLGVIAGA